jgi:hypothetical protein
MTEKQFWFVAGIPGAVRGGGLDASRAEPSHIHIPRRARARRPDGAGDPAAWGARAGGGAPATPSADERAPA